MRLASLSLAALCTAALCGCGNVLQDQPVPHNLLEGLVVARFPVYWLGTSFHGLAVTDVEQDPSGAYWLQYGDCLGGGQQVCAPPLRVVTSPDNSFLPGGARSGTGVALRHVRALLLQNGKTVLIPTGGVVVGVYASAPGLARAAAGALAPINAPGAPQAPLPRALPDSGYGRSPLPSQVPPPVRVLG